MGDDTSGASVSLGEAAIQFLSGLSPEAREMSRQEIYRFVRWYGWRRAFNELTVLEVANYAEQLAASGADVASVLEPVRAFLIYAKRNGLTKASLAAQLRARKNLLRVETAAKSNSSQARLTVEGYADLEAELAALKSGRRHMAEELRNAAADKDFRENAPLDALKEEQGYLEARIRELELKLKSAVVIEQGATDSLKVGFGDRVVVKDLTSGEELAHMLVDPSEADLSKGKISVASPIGKALLGREQGSTVEVKAPAGVLQYQILSVQH